MRKLILIGGGYAHPLTIRNIRRLIKRAFAVVGSKPRFSERMKPRKLV